MVDKKGFLESLDSLILRESSHLFMHLSPLEGIFSEKLCFLVGAARLGTIIFIHLVRIPKLK